MRILILSRTFPLPLNNGEKIRTYHVLRELSKHHEVSLVSLVHQDLELEYLGELKQICQEIYPFKLKFSKKISAAKVVFSKYPWEVIAFYKKEVKCKTRQLVRTRDFDIIWVNFLSMMRYLDHDLASRSAVILDQHNADELVWRRYAQESDNAAIRLFATLNLKRLKGFQREIMNYLSAIVSVSEEDTSFTRNQIPAHIDTWTAPNGVDTNYFQPLNSNQRKANVIMLCGSMDTLMNIDAALRFAKEIFPLIKGKVPDTEFWIVGKNPVEQICNLAKQDHIRVTGTVQDVRPYYEKAKVFVAPFRFGGGTKLKILEAMAMNIPIVSTSVGCQGIDAINGIHLFIRDSMEEFAKTVIKLLEDEKETNKLMNNGRRLVEARYSWSSIMETFEPKLLQLVKQRSSK